MGGGALFTIQCKSDYLTLWSSDASEVEEWIRVLNDTISKLLQNRQTLRKCSSAKEPVHGSRAVLKHTRQASSAARKRSAEEASLDSGTTLSPSSEPVPEGTTDMLYPMRSEMGGVREQPPVAKRMRNRCYQQDGGMLAGGTRGMSGGGTRGMSGGTRSRRCTTAGGSNNNEGVLNNLWKAISSVTGAITNSLQANRDSGVPVGPVGPHTANNRCCIQ